MGLIKWVILIAVVGILVWRIWWHSGEKSEGYNGDVERYRFIITDNDYERKYDGTTSVSGVVVNCSVAVGDTLSLVDEQGTPITKNVTIVSIDAGTLKKKLVDEAQPNDTVTLCLKMPDIKLKVGYTLVIDEQETEDAYSQFMDERYEEDTIDDDDDYQSMYRDDD